VQNPVFVALQKHNNMGSPRRLAEVTANLQRGLPQEVRCERQTTTDTVSPVEKRKVFGFALALSRTARKSEK
jgi:hypothetical protein